jgi:hypothetical protein
MIYQQFDYMFLTQLIDVYLEYIEFQYLQQLIELYLKKAQI